MSYCDDCLHKEVCGEEGVGDESMTFCRDKVISCEDTISRQAVINAIANTCFWLSSDDWEELVKCINSILPVTPQPKTGHWIRQDNTKKPLYGWYFCSECNSVIGDKTEFCSNCGAKMEDKE